MKNYFKFSLLVLFLIVIECSLVISQPIKVITFNIRIDLQSDGKNAWDNRKENLVSLLKFHKPDIFGLQEAQKHQIDFIEKSLPEYSWFGVGRDDGKDKGEFAAIFYRKDRFDTLSTSTFWCSETPDHPGLGWDAAYQRITTFGKFNDKLSGKTFYLFNTHLDNEGKVARVESAKLIKSKMKFYCGNLPAILLGDFNSIPNSDPYNIITSNSTNESPFILRDSRLISRCKPYGPHGTFTGFEITAKPEDPIDFIFVRKGISVRLHAVLSDSFDGYLPSDHYPVMAEIEF